MNSYFGYVRVSTVRQGEGVSLDQQKSAITTYARVHGLEIAAWFEEKESASKLGRPIFNEMLRALQAQKVSGIIIHKIDRSARHLNDWVWIGQLIDRGVDVRFVHENLDLTSRSGRLTGDLIAVIAADYSRNLRDEVRKGQSGRLKQGLYPFTAPLGYLNCGGGKVKEIDPINGPLVRRAFELYASRRYSLHTLGIELKRLGLQARAGKPLSVANLAVILKNPFYMGVIRIRRTGETYEGKHPPLITKALFDRVQAILHDRSNTKVQLHDFTFRRLIMCAACGYALTAERQKGRAYYRCHQRQCRKVSIREDSVLSDIRWFHELIRLPEEDLRDLRDFIAADQVSARKTRAVEVARIKRAIGLLDERLSRLTDAVVDLVIDRESYETKKAALLIEKRGLCDQLAEPETKTQAQRLLEKFELGNEAYLGVSSLIPLEIRDALEKTTSNLSVEGKDLVITPSFPFYELAKQRLVSLGAAHRAALRKDASLVLSAPLLPLPNWKPGGLQKFMETWAPEPNSQQRAA
jgi:DNA invertase Pin-like site-specific DNA recombinase